MNKKVSEQLNQVKSVSYILSDGAEIGLAELEKRCAEINDKVVTVKLRNRSSTVTIPKKRPTIGVDRPNE